MFFFLKIRHCEFCQKLRFLKKKPTKNTHRLTVKSPEVHGNATAAVRLDNRTNYYVLLLLSAFLFRPQISGGGRNYILKRFIYSVNFGRSIYSSYIALSGIIKKHVQRRKYN